MHHDDLIPWRPIRGTRQRASSYDPSGGNRDYWIFKPGETKTLLEHQGSPGAVLRLWLTLNSADPMYLQHTLVSMQFDNEPTVTEMPLGIFTGTGPWAVNDICSPPASIMRSRKGHQDQLETGYGSFNLTWRMPFSGECIIRIHNRSEVELMLFFHVDYLMDCDCDEAPFLFHAVHNLQRQTIPQGRCCSAPSSATDSLDSKSKHRSVDHNYVFADINGFAGNYVGTILAVESHPDNCGKWYEGDDMFLVDGETWPPSLHGTGTEDYFGMAWGIHRRYQGWDHGVVHYERDITDHDRFYDGRFVLYRWHLADPIPFRRSLHASIEAGHANDCAQFYESVALWYGRRIE